ncbi:proline-rich protein HaeIII subfamily 1 [Eptesicus fuscus]|uniref:proline-rich protein HaeIII subfamily 1 n=1 Tax=Eptesicus fuscus TaxID=29078 RepID=UPI00240475E7|nr:proline-rich protein HaeIII subfamily 1 [Eptesicus fuscus]
MGSPPRDGVSPRGENSHQCGSSPRQLQAHVAEVRKCQRSPALTSAASPLGGRARGRVPPPARPPARAPGRGPTRRLRERRGGAREPRAEGGRHARDPAGRARRRAAGGAVAGSPGAGRDRRTRAPAPLPRLLLRPEPQRPRAAGVAVAAGARVPPPPAPSRRLLRGRQQLQAAPQRPPPHHPGSEPWPGPRRPRAARGMGPSWVRSTWPDHSLTHCDLQTWEPCQRPPAAGRSSAFTKMAAPAAPHAEAILGFSFSNCRMR